MPKKSTEFVIRVQAKGRAEEPIAGPYWQRRDAIRALPKLLEGFPYEQAVRAVAYERPSASTGWSRRDPKQVNDRKQWVEVARATKPKNGRAIVLTEMRSS